MDKWLRLLVMLSSFLVMFVLAACVIRVLGFIPHTLVLFSLGILLAYALDPLVESLRDRRLALGGRVQSREFCVGVVTIGFLVLMGLAIWSLGGRLVKQADVLHHDRLKYEAELLRRSADSDAWLRHHDIHFSVLDSFKHPPAQLVTLGQKVAGQVLPVVGHFFVTMGESFIVLLIAVYFLLYSTEMREGFNKLLPADLRGRVEAWQADVNRILGGFVRGQLLIAILVGSLAAILCLAIGIHLWLIIGMFVVCAALIPVFGPYLGAVPALLAAIIGPTHFSPTVSAVLVIVGFTVINEIGSKIIYPKLVGQALGMHAVLVLFVLFSGLEIAGVLGVLFAAPLTALAIVTIVHLYRLWQDLPDSPIKALHPAHAEGPAVEASPKPAATPKTAKAK
jgi:predicted PurR-regulated permease PerM